MTDPRALSLESMPDPRALDVVVVQTQALWVWQPCETKTPGFARPAPGFGITHKCHIQGA